CATAVRVASAVNGRQPFAARCSLVSRSTSAASVDSPVAGAVVRGGAGGVVLARGAGGRVVGAPARGRAGAPVGRRLITWMPRDQTSAVLPGRTSSTVTVYRPSGRVRVSSRSANGAVKSLYDRRRRPSMAKITQEPGGAVAGPTIWY